MMQSRALPLLLLICLVLPAAAQQPDSPPNGTLAVKGEGLAEMKPDYAQFHAAVSTRGKTLTEAAAAHEERATRALAILQGLKGGGVDIIETSFGINQDAPAYGRPPSEKPPERQFTAVTNFDVRVKPVAVLNGIITKLASSGLFEVQRVFFHVDQERNALNQARRDAVKDARDQAEAYADAGGVKLIDILEIADGEAVPMSATGEADLAVARYVQIIPPATVTFRASVKITWRVAPR
jgi:uncharacterized protein YggE